MANGNLTVVSRSSQFKDYFSAKERLLNCGIQQSSNKKNRLKEKKRGSLNPLYLYGSKIALV